ncbi:T9SS type B sorting domain-containing protein [uncultured Polaribacter sp.]|uniref:T9SS type B sorting domain-containing protein n=1 Tax=uncultured Polaribacter sp. TaxID=174711 RepID=UPI0026379F8E|nr:T9SS type B sorting domain-containing protein [uncultured Polaribacter sp.]
MPLNLLFKRIKILISIFIFTLNSFSQTIRIDNVSNSKEELVNLLVNNPCIKTTNVQISSNQSIAYFNNNGGDFPLSEGIIIRNGIAKYSEGSYTNTNLSSEISQNSDPQLQAIINQNGQTSKITDVAFLEFDFVPLGNSFNFNFLFASNEYGEFQCGFSDVFAIFLINLDTGETINLATLPESNKNISVQNIRNNLYNSSCSSINPNLFDTFNDENSTNSLLNMRGYTKTLNAVATVVPNNSYQLKFAIGDNNDADYDSAVFIQSGGFDITLDLGADKTICDGEKLLIDSGYTNTTDFKYTWFRNGDPILGEENPTIEINQTGVYSLEASITNSGCVLTDEITIFDLPVNTPQNLYQCTDNNIGEFDLTTNNLNNLGIDENIYNISYYNSLTNAIINNPLDSSVLTNYQSSGNETIYIKLYNKTTNSFCNAILEFKLLFLDVKATKPNNFSICENENIINLSTLVETEILNNADSVNYTINYFLSESEANNNDNKIANPLAFQVPNNVDDFTVWARLMNNNCFDIVNFQIDIIKAPILNEIEDIIACTTYILPNLASGFYYTGPNKTGNQLFSGDEITENTTLYIYNENTQGCFIEENFTITLAKDFSIDLEHCNQYIIPESLLGEFYTEKNGPNGTGNLITPGTAITESSTIYFYAQIEDVFCSDEEYQLIIYNLPVVDSKNDVVTCNSYQLPKITNGNYFTENNGEGNLLKEGDLITSSQTIYIFNENTTTNCTNSNSFTVSIIDQSEFKDIVACNGQYIIPSFPFGNYYTENNGLGSIIPSGTVITNSQTVYYYAPEITTTDNCTGIELSIIVYPIVPVDVLDNIIKCENDLPTLPVLTNGNYFTEANGEGINLTAGDLIDTSQTIYIYNKTNFCDNESSFNISIKEIPTVDNFTDISSCEPYTLPTLKNGQYFTETNGQGTELFAGQIIETTQDVYIFNKDNEIGSCSNENVFRVNVYGIIVDKPANVLACESYTLPKLNVGEYYTESGGNGVQLSHGDVITASQTIYIYAQNGNRFFCEDEHAFTVDIFETPTITIPNLETCGSVTLPNLSDADITVEYYRSPNKEDFIDLKDYTITTIGSQTIYFHAYPKGNPNCFQNGNFNIHVYPLLDLEIQGGTICVDYKTGNTTNPFLLQSNLDVNEFTVQWFLEDELVGTGPDYNAFKAGTYTVKTIKLQPEMPPNCNYYPTEVVVESSNPKFEIKFLTNYFVNLYTIEVNETNFSFGNYMYALDDGPFQESPIFENIGPGLYTLKVKDLTGICGDYFVEFTAFDYPKFFTPNGDGINDTWNITDIKDDLNATIKIFSRYGELITVIKPSEKGWNGYNNYGKKAKPSDYWFVVEYKQGDRIAQFRAHFSLLNK